MKRDMELCRLILLEIEQEQHISKTIKHPERDVLYHFNILEEAGLIKRQKGRNWEITAKMNDRLIPAGSYKLTWEGHNFIDAARDETFFKKALKEIKSKGAALTFNVLLEYLQAKTKEMLGI